MDNIEKLVRERRSVRTFDGRKVTAEDREKLCRFIETIDNPYGIPVQFKLLEKMSCPVVVGTDLYVGAKIKTVPYLNEAFGYAFEKLVIYAQSLGIGTVWIGGTMDRAAFERAMELSDNEVMPCVSPLGYPAKKMSFRESMMRKGIKADERLAFENIAYRNSSGKLRTICPRRRPTRQCLHCCRCRCISFCPMAGRNGRSSAAGDLHRIV